ncbi:MAG: ATP-binding protein [Verrucomicrobiales bacterium]|nr:ATP-binding protein [Verrucomicrobiales bacterium]
MGAVEWERASFFLVLCGSYLRFIEREVLGKRSPLFGRRTGQIHLKPFNHLASALHQGSTRQIQGAIAGRARPHAA